MIDSFSREVRLGEGVEATHRLSNDAMARTIEALRICAAKIARHPGAQTRAIATEACRRAVNGREFIERAGREAGIALEIITAEEEARLAVAGCAPLVERETDEVIVVDIGGGSTEIAWVDLSGVPDESRTLHLRRLGDSRWRRGGDRVEWISVPMGVVTLSDKFAEVESPARRFGLMTWYFEENLAAFRPRGAEGARLQLIGTSGTVTTIGAAILGLKRYDRSRVDGLWMERAKVRRIVERLAALDDRARARHPSIGEGRAEFILSGGAILDAVLRLWPVERLRAADRGLREGLIYGLMADAPAELV